jgi:hypothetical protein
MTCTFLTAAMLTSFAVQFTDWLFPAAANSSCKQFCANAGVATMANASNA